MRRRTRGTETWTRLQQWTQGPVASERLAAQVLRAEGFEGVDPSHPLGGPDRLKDVVCERAGRQWRAAAYFPRGQKRFAEVAKKFNADLGNTQAQSDGGFIFITNQELRLSERKRLHEVASVKPLEVYHLDRIASVLDSPRLYGVRLEFLDIEMTREEQVAFFSEMQRSNEELIANFKTFVREMGESGILEQKLKSGVPLAELREFSSLLSAVTGRSTFLSAISGRHGPGLAVIAGPSVYDLRVPLAELREFSSLLSAITGRSTPLRPVSGRSGPDSVFALRGPTIHDLRVPLAELREFSALLSDAVEKAKELGTLSRQPPGQTTMTDTTAEVGCEARPPETTDPEP